MITSHQNPGQIRFLTVSKSGAENCLYQTAHISIFMALQPEIPNFDENFCKY